MNLIPFTVRLITEQYNWLVDYSEKTGESMVSIVRQALKEFRRKYD